MILDTTSSPQRDNFYSSWGTITVRSVQVSIPINGDAAASLARSVVGGKYLWGGQGWDWSSDLLVESQQIVNGYTYCKVVQDPKTKKNYCERVFDKGLDCAGLVLWAHNKAVGAVTRFGGPVQVEGADNIYRNNSIEVAEAALQPGDLLFFDNLPKNGFMDHVAMYVGGNDPIRNVVEAANPQRGIVYSSLADRKADSKFVGFRRLNPTKKELVVQSHSPINLIVTDPDGITIDAGTLIVSDQEPLREIPGFLYYKIEGDDDIVYAPVLKVGTYTIRVEPKPGVDPSEVYSLDVEGAATLITLARNVRVADIPLYGYKVRSTGSEIMPLPSFVYLPLIRR